MRLLDDETPPFQILAESHQPVHQVIAACDAPEHILDVSRAFTAGKLGHAVLSSKPKVGSVSFKWCSALSIESNKRRSICTAWRMTLTINCIRESLFRTRMVLPRLFSARCGIAPASLLNSCG